MVWSIAGLVAALAGAWIGSSLPVVTMLELSGEFGGASDEKIQEVDRIYKRKSLLANLLLVEGTALQIWGAVLA